MKEWFSLLKIQEILKSFSKGGTKKVRLPLQNLFTLWTVSEHEAGHVSLGNKEGIIIVFI